MAITETERALEMAMLNRELIEELRQELDRSHRAIQSTCSVLRSTGAGLTAAVAVIEELLAFDRGLVGGTDHSALHLA